MRQGRVRLTGLSPRALRPANIRAAAWTLRAARAVRRSVGRGGIGALDLPPPPAGLPFEQRRTVAGVLRRIGAMCLLRSAVLQAWDAAHGLPRDLVIGVTAPRDFKAHAWLEGDPQCHDGEFAEVYRRPARR